LGLATAGSCQTELHGSERRQSARDRPKRRCSGAHGRHHHDRPAVGTPRRIETWFYRVDGTVYLTGLPGRRGWAANLESEPAFTFHLKNGVEADLPARATQVVDEAERRRIMRDLLDDLSSISDTPRDLEAWVAGSPLFAVEFDCAVALA
jgi:hypothetical protein